MKRDDLILTLSVICAVSGVIGTILNATIALGVNRHIGRCVEKKFAWFKADYGDKKSKKGEDITYHYHN